MAIDNKDIALSIIEFLKTSVVNKTVSEDYADSMEVAIDCIADSFEVDKDTKSAKLGGKPLSELISAGLLGSATAATTGTTHQVDEATKAKADALKLEGNRAMAAKDFKTAIVKYTAAIELDSTNVVYLSNRAAAYSSDLNHQQAVVDAEKAIELDPNFSKSYSRLGLAKYALGDAKAAMDAYKKGLDVESEKPSDAMKRGYETAKRRVEEELEREMPSSEVASTDRETPSPEASTGAGSGAGAGGLPDLASMFGGGAGGMPNISDMMNNPQLMQAAQSMMSNPDAMANLMNNPMIRNMAQSFGLGGENGQMPDLSEIMNNPALRNMFGGSGQGEN
ncbi:Small glutamine-rich tetratricopeptide repeat-containing protein 2 [Yamadazyma tenuis]|uniref:Small glutamine-rich tetratricopeptide repeat-containing protein 2 n=1 Tax=Candida tenuis TaxID=2315449 RepID=UPI0027A79403|nr:Small glutamine-rich tetratricopeptide repeat-containing protein 2 [Yamadazyma tenuis]